MLVRLQAASSRGRALTFRVIDRPAHGTVSLTGDRATYFPETGFVGEDAFTYAAWDGDNDSNLARVDVTVEPADCALAATARVPAAAAPGDLVPFNGSLSLAGCDGAMTCDWDFGDGTDHSAETNAVHVYAEPGDYFWTLTLTANDASRTVSGVITVSPTLGPPVTLTITSYDFILSVSWPWDAIPVSLETAGSPAPGLNSWQPVREAPFAEFDGSTTNVWLFRLAEPQFFRLRRVP